MWTAKGWGGPGPGVCGEGPGPPHPRAGRAPRRKRTKAPATRGLRLCRRPRGGPGRPPPPAEGGRIPFFGGRAARPAGSVRRADKPRAPPLRGGDPFPLAKATRPPQGPGHDARNLPLTIAWTLGGALSTTFAAAGGPNGGALGLERPPGRSTAPWRNAALAKRAAGSLSGLVRPPPLPSQTGRGPPRPVSVDSLSGPVRSTRGSLSGSARAGLCARARASLGPVGTECLRL